MPGMKFKKGIIWTIVCILSIGGSFSFAARLPFVCKPFAPEMLNKVGPCYNKTLINTENLSLTGIETFNPFSFMPKPRANDDNDFASFLFSWLIFPNFTPLRC